VRSALLPGSGHDRLLAVMQIRRRRPFRHLCSFACASLDREDPLEDGNLHRISSPGAIKRPRINVPPVSQPTTRRATGAVAGESTVEGGCEGPYVDAFDRHVKAAKLPRIRLHDLRHGWATLALQQGIHPKVVSEVLGHSTIAITQDTYSHAIPTMQETAVELVAPLVGS
jgi:integrase